MDELDKQPVPPGGPVNQPASGTQGDKASLTRLRGALPGPIPGTPPPGAPPGGGGGVVVPPGGPGPVGPPGQESPVPGIPSSIISPTDRPDIPIQSPPSGPPGAGIPQLSASQDVMRVLSALAQSEDEEAREWANLVIQELLDR